MIAPPRPIYRDGINCWRCAFCLHLVPCSCAKGGRVETDTPPGWKTESETLELVSIGPLFVVDSIAVVQRPGVPPSLDQCGQALLRCVKIKDAVKYWLGDLMNLTEGLFAEEAAQVIDHELLSEAEAREYMFVAKAVAPTIRAVALSWDHAKAVARLDPDAQRDWLEKARVAEQPWSARKMASEIAQAKADGKHGMRWWLVVECGTEAKRDKLADELGPRGYNCKRQEKLVRLKPEPKRKKKAAVTAQKRQKGAPKRNRRERVPA